MSIAAGLCAALGCGVDVPTFTPDPGPDACPTASNEDAPYGGGEGTRAAPFRLCSVEQLTAITTRPQDLGAAFVLGRDLDLGGAAFPGIGSLAAPFTGTFDGGEFGIANVMISGTDAVGLFNAVNSARLTNVRLENVMVQGSNQVGSVIGYCDRSQLRSATVVSATVSGANSIGGLIGETIECTVAQVALTASVTGTGEGIAGVVGLAGRSAFVDVEATIDVNAPLGISVGGVVGVDDYHPVILQNVNVSGTVVGNEDVGGIVGMNGDGSQIHRSRFAGTVRGNIGVGGFVGAAYDSPFHVYSSSVVADITGTTAVGGFAGRHYYRTNFYDSFYKGTLTGVGQNQTAFGGFFGDVEYYGWVERSFVDVTIDSQATSVGGFMGHNGYWSSNSATYDITRSFAVANVTGSDVMNTVSFFVGKNTDPNPLAGVGSYYWSGGTCSNIGGTCAPGGAGIADRTQLQNPGSAPLSAWDFTNVWRAVPGENPALRLEQLAQPVPTATCPTVAISGLYYECDPAISDADANEVSVALLGPDHSCAWLSADTIGPNAASLQHSASLSGIPPLDAGTCTVDFSVTDGPNLVATTPIALDIHLGVVMTPSQNTRAHHSFGIQMVGTVGPTVIFTLTNRESTRADISISGLPGNGFRFAGAMGTYPGTGGSCGAFLSPFGTCTVAIAFAPTVAGSIEHEISLHFTAARGPVSYPFELAGYAN